MDNVLALDLEWLSPFRGSAILALAIVIVGVWIVQISFGNKSPPGNPWALPYLGDAVELATTLPIKFFWSRYKKYGSVFTIRLPTGKLYVTADPQSFRTIMKYEGAVTYMPSGFTKLLGSLDHMNHKEEHMGWRKHFTLALGPAGIQRMLPELKKVVDRHLDKWEAAGKFPLMAAMNQVSLDFGVDVLTGLDLPADLDKEWTKARIMEFINGLYSLPLDLPGTDFRKALTAKEQLREVLLPLCEKELRSILAKGTKPVTETEAGSLTMLEAQVLPTAGFREATGEMMFHRVLGNYVASVDTTRYMLWITVALASLSPRVMKKLREEQDKAMQEVGLELDYSALQSMSYMDATIREAMRIMPAANGTLRKLVEPLQIGKYTLPTGSHIMWTTWLNHALDPALYDGNTSCDIPPHMDWLHNLEHAFQPERWLEGSDGKPKMFSTFGYGVHLCLGMNLAFMETKLMFASMLRRFEYQFEHADVFSTCVFFPGPRPKGNQDVVVLRPVKASNSS